MARERSFASVGACELAKGVIGVELGVESGLEELDLAGLLGGRGFRFHWIEFAMCWAEIVDFLQKALQMIMQVCKVTIRVSMYKNTFYGTTTYTTLYA